MKLNLRRVESGCYSSRPNNRVRLYRMLDREDKICWRIYIDNKALVVHELTKKDAVIVAEVECKKRNIWEP